MLCPATRRKCTAEPRSAKEWRWISAAKQGMAKEEQGNAAPRRRHGIGAIGDGQARKRTAPRRTGNGPIRSGVEQPSWDRLRMATAQTRCATRSEGKARHGSVMAKQSRGKQRRWTDAGSEGVALRIRAWRRQSEARHGQGKAKRGKAKAKLLRDLPGDGFEMQYHATAQPRATTQGTKQSTAAYATERLRDPGQCMAMAWRRDALRLNAKEQQCSVMQRQRVALMRRGVAQPRMAGA